MARVVDRQTFNSLTSTDIKLPSLTASTVLFTDASKVLSSTGAITDSFLATISTAGKISNSATSATSANTNSAIVARDSNGAFNASKLTLAGQDTFIATSSGTQSIADSTPTDFTTWNAGTGSCVTLSSGDFKITTAGTFCISCMVEWASNTTGARIQSLLLGGVTKTTVQILPSTAGILTRCVALDYVLAVDDVIKLNVWQSSTGSLDVASARMSITRVY